MLATAYLNHLVLVGYRPDTIRARRNCLRAFEASLAPRPLGEATRLDVESYLARPLAPESRRAYRSHLRSFYAWAVEQEYLHTDPTTKIPSIRVPRAQPRPLNDADVALALNASHPRMRAWLLLMALGGLRCCEVARLRPCDLMSSEVGTLLWLREMKGGGQGTVPAHPVILEALAVLPVQGGLWWDCSPDYVSTSVNRHLRALGIAATAHGLRHTAATSWFRVSGHDALVTAQLLRHANIATVPRYAALDPVRPAQVVHLVKPPTSHPIGA